MELFKKFIGTYKLNLLLSLTAAVSIIGLRFEKNPIDIFFIILGSLAGSFILDLDYFSQAYWDNPSSEFSLGFKDLLKQRNYVALISYMQLHGPSLNKLVLHSALFQVIMATLAFFLVTSSNSVFAVALGLATFSQTFLEMFKDYERAKSIDSWFWFLKEKTSKKSQLAYVFAITIILIYIFTQVPKY